MGSILVDLIPIVIGTAVVPVWVILVVLLLRGDNGLTKALAFVGGGIAVRLAQGVVFGLIFGGTAESSGGDEQSGAIASTLMLVVGLLMWVTAIKTFIKEDDPDTPPKWMTVISAVTPPKALGFGALLVVIGAKHWIFTLSAIKVIQAGGLSQAGAIVAFLIYVLGASALLLAPILIRIIAPQGSKAILAAIGTWLEQHNRMIMIVVSVIFGTFFLFRGISGLLG